MPNEKSDPVQTQEFQTAELSTHLATVLSKQSAAIYLSASMQCSPLSVFTIESHHQYFESFLKDLVPEFEMTRVDPILRLQVEQVLFAHHNIGRLYADAAIAKDLEVRKALVSVAAQLIAEFRRLSAAVRQEILMINTVERSSQFGTPVSPKAPLKKQASKPQKERAA
jgi:hypothetical protein